MKHLKDVFSREGALEALRSCLAPQNPVLREAGMIAGAIGICILAAPAIAWATAAASVPVMFVSGISVLASYAACVGAGKGICRAVEKIDSAGRPGLQAQLLFSPAANGGFTADPAMRQDFSRAIAAMEDGIPTSVRVKGPLKLKKPGMGGSMTS